jgi:hypothetical protein
MAVQGNVISHHSTRQIRSELIKSETKNEPAERDDKEQSKRKKILSWLDDLIF